RWRFGERDAIGETRRRDVGAKTTAVILPQRLELRAKPLGVSDDRGIASSANDAIRDFVRQSLRHHQLACRSERLWRAASVPPSIRSIRGSCSGPPCSQAIEESRAPCAWYRHRCRPVRSRL